VGKDKLHFWLTFLLVAWGIVVGVGVLDWWFKGLFVVLKELL